MGHTHVVADDGGLQGHGCAHERIPFKDLTPEEKKIVYDGPAVKKHIVYTNKGSGQAVPLDFTYFNAVRTVENALSKVKDEKGMKRIEKFLTKGPVPCLSWNTL